MANGRIHQKGSGKHTVKPSTITLEDTGLGTTYERWALNRVLTNLKEKYPFQRVLEGPGDGMTGIKGINSLVLGLSGNEVSLLIDNEPETNFAEEVWQIHAPRAAFSIEYGELADIPSDSQDLVWNFNIMTRAENPPSLLAEMARISKKYVFFCVPNAQNYSFWLHRLHHKVAKDPWDHGDIDLMRPNPWQRTISDLELELVETIYLDCPWWPDIVDLGQLISDFFLFLKDRAQKAKPENRLKWKAEELLS